MNQPAPKPTDGPAIWDLVIADMSPAVTPLERTIVADMRRRDELGRATYGTPLQAHNGRDALHDAYAEALDAVVYLRQVAEEGLPVDACYRKALDLAEDIRLEIAERDGE